MTEGVDEPSAPAEPSGSGPDGEARRSEKARAVERAAVAEAVAASLRHDVRNKLASVRNAMFYLRRQLTGGERWQADPRVPQFFDLVDSELGEAERLLGEGARVEGVFGTEEVQLAGIVRGAVAGEAALSSGRVHLELRMDPEIRTPADPAEAALAVGCLLRNAVEALGDRGAGEVRVRLSETEDGRAALEVRDDGVGLGALSGAEAVRELTTTKPERAGLGLAIARRFALRHGGSLSLTREGEWTVARLVLCRAGGGDA